MTLEEYRAEIAATRDWALVESQEACFVDAAGDPKAMAIIMARHLRTERERCAAWARKFEADWRAQGKIAAAGGAEIIAKKIESGDVVA